MAKKKKSKNRLYLIRIFLIGILIVLLMILTGYKIIQQERITSMTQKQSSTVTPTALPIVEAKQSSTDITTWKTFTSTDGIYSFKYPAQSLKPFEGVGPDDGIYGTTLYPREGYIGILVYDKQLPCPHGEIQQLQLHGKTIAACHSISDDGSESWEGLVTYPTKTFKVIGSTEPTHMMSGTMTAGEDKKVILQILSTLTFQ